LEQETVQDQDLFELDPFDTVIGQEENDSDSDSDGVGDNLSDLSSDAGDMDDESQPFEIATNVKHINDMVKKLDAILTLIFDHFHRAHTSIATSGTLPLSLTDLPPLPSLTPLSSPLGTPIPSRMEPSSFEQTIVSDTSPLTSVPPSRSETLERSTGFLRSQFLNLLSIFDRTILRTFKSRYTQFLIFWYTSLDPEFSDIFQGMLVDRALFENDADSTAQNPTPVVTRAAAASYLGSFVSRAVFVDREGARRVVAVLCEFLKAHLEAVEELVRTGGEVGGVTQNTVFYAVTQAVFLIFCFRWRDLLEDEQDEDDLLNEKGGKQWMAQLNVLQRAVTSNLNPLRVSSLRILCLLDLTYFGQVCSPGVVKQFAKVAHATDFIYCYTILDSNKRSEYGPPTINGHILPITSALGRPTSRPTAHWGSINVELNTFFPFDPYSLPKSNVYVQAVYREWSTVAIGDEDDEEEEEADYADRDVRIGGQLRILRSDNHGGDEEGLGESLGKMSISPMYPAVQPSIHA
jgi:RNA polymerase I-specific transcription initiation factor RRN3